MAKKQKQTPQSKPQNRQNPKPITESQKGQTIQRPAAQLNPKPKKK